MADITHNDPLVTESKLTEFYNDIKPFLGCPAYVTQEGDAEYYSTDEKVVGRWTDGKPLYQKSYIITRSSTGNISANLDITNLEKIYNITGAIRDNNNNTIDIGYCNQENIWIDSTVIHIDTGSSLGTYYITLQYTKATDSAATTVETKPTHYSTDEQVVGTWIDSKPVYQKTFVKTNLINNSWNTSNHDIANIDTVIGLDGGMIGDTGGFNSTGIWSNNGYGCSFYANRTIIEFYINYPSLPDTAKAIITMRYTKITD